jgi:glycosyltransferase involved in cell wall biosynthesis
MYVLVMMLRSKMKNTYSSIYKNQVYVCIGYDAKKQEEKLKRISPDTFKVLISDKTKNVSDKFDLYLSNKSIKLFDVDKYKGWFKITDAQNLFSFIDIKVKHKYLEMMDYYIGAEKEYEKKLSIVICTYKRSEKLNNVLTTSINQTLSKENYEIIVINNDIHDTGVYEVVSQFRKEYNLSDEFLKFCEAPVKGLSFARNVGLFEAKGKRILYLDDDSVAFEDLAEQIIKAYEDNEDAGVVGGQIILKLPKKIPSAFMKGKEAYWSQFLIADSDYKIVNEWYEFPYGANFSVDTKTLLKIGGFRTGYGRVGHNFAGGEEVVVSLLAKRIGKEVVLAPNAKVYHDVDESRYTFEHVEKTDIGGAYTRLRMELDLYKSPYYLIKKRVKEEINYLKQQLNEAKTEKERRYLISNIKGHEIGLKEIDKINREIIKSFKNMSLKKK